MPKTTTVHDLARAYADLDSQAKEADAHAKSLKAARANFQDQLIDAMIDEGTSSLDILTADGKAKLFVSNKLFARRDPGVDEAAFFCAVHAAGLGALIKDSVNANSLASAVREMAEEHGVRDSGSDAILAVLPPELAAAITVQTSPTISLRRS